jgi:hypothetical protein
MNPAILQAAGVVLVSVGVFFGLCWLEVRVGRKNHYGSTEVKPIEWTD